MGLEQGREMGLKQGALEVVLRLGRKRLGEPSQAARAWLETLSHGALEELADRLLEAESWDEMRG
jgi:hypothetical protein